MTNYPAPPPLPVAPTGPPAKAGVGAYPALAAAVLGLLGLLLPWYSPKLSRSLPDLQIQPLTYHAWSGWFFLVAAPIALIAYGMFWLQALRGRHNSRFAASADPVRTLSMQSIIAGVVALALALLSTVLVKHHYKNWDEAARLAQSQGASLQKNPQLGLYCGILGALALIAAGAIGLLLKSAGSAAGPSASGPVAFGAQQFEGQQFGAQPQFGVHPQSGGQPEA